MNFLKDLSVVRDFNELNKLIKDLDNILELLSVSVYKLLLVHESLLLSFVFALEAYNDILFLLLQLADQLREAILDVADLNLHEPFQLISDLPDKNRVFINEPSCIINHFAEINDILLQ